MTADGIGGEIFQLGTSVETSVLELARLIQEVTRRRGRDRLRGAPGRRGLQELRRHQQGAALLGFQLAIDVKDGLGRTTEWYREQRA